MSGNITRSRSRPRLFDEEAALDQLTALFWRQGYSQTSIADLVEASGMHRSSLYSTFGTKEELFAIVLRRYMAARTAMFATLIAQAGPGIDDIHAFLEALRAAVISDPTQQGCLLDTSCAELCGTTPSFEDFGPEYRRAFRQQLRVLIRQAEPANSADDVLTDQRTEVVLAFLLGLMGINRGGADQDEIGRFIDALHATVDTWRP